MNTASSNHDAGPLHDRVIASAHELGFALAGIAPALPSPYETHLREWIAQGKHGEMAYLADHLELRLDVDKLLPDAKAVICVADQHPAAIGYDTEARSDQDNCGRPAIGRIARYAWGRDYHKVIKKRLFDLADRLRAIAPDAEFRCAVDTAPIMEREHAARAGLGWIGKHTLLLHPQRGSWMLLGVIVTTLDLTTTAQSRCLNEAAAPQRFFGEHFQGCGTCTRCIDACPTRCIDPAGHTLDASRCISYLTIEHRSVIDPALHEPMGDWIAGCDVCQEVCPFNQRDDETKDKPPIIHDDYQPGPLAPGVPLMDVLDWTEADRREAFRGSALKRIKLAMLLRNALIAAGNALRRYDDPALRERIERFAGDESADPMVRQTANDVLSSVP